MCEKKHCYQKFGPLCSCSPVQARDTFQMAIHLAENITDVDWHLSYQSMECVTPYQLCLVGRCRICGGRLCMEQKPFGVNTTDDFLAALYRHLYQFHRNMGQRLSEKEFRSKFVEMFHEEDKSFVTEWLVRPENSHVARMYCRSVSKTYTIVHTSVDADRGSFPDPLGMGSYTDQQTARDELWRLVEKEKEEMDIHFDPDLYREEYGDDFWEAYQDGYAAAWFTRYQILECPLYSVDKKEDEKDV